MKQESPPTFYYIDQETKRKTVVLETFIAYLQEAHSLEFVKTHQKNIEQHLSILSKTVEIEEHLYQILTFICNLFKTNPHIAYLSMIRVLINVDSKFEAKNSQTSMQQQNIRMINTNEVIALPNYQELPPPPVIALHGPEPMSDVTDQRIHSSSKNYFNQDNLMVQEFIKNPFIVVKREGISSYYTKSVQIICKELYKQYLLKHLIQLPISIVLDLLKLLEEVKDSIFSFQLLNISESIINRLTALFEIPQTQKRLAKDQAQSMIIIAKKLVEQFSQYKRDIEEETEWNLSYRIISLFINSHVSQKKLFAVKLLSQRCRRSTYYPSKITREVLQKYINNANILSEIYRADNHPQVITKGEEIFLYLVGEQNLDQNYINIVFNLLEKCHEHLSKSLFSTLQRTGHRNIEKNRKYLLKKILDLPRPSCFNEETFILIDAILVATPSQESHDCLQVLYGIMQKNYDRLKQNLKNKAVISYFQVFIMGIQTDIFTEENAMLTLKPILHSPDSSLFPFMIENFIYRLKDQYTKQIGVKCKKTLNIAIKKLICQQKIHELKVKDQEKHFYILNLLLENVEDFNQTLLSSEELWTLIKSNRKFAKFLKFYPQQIQISLISHLIFSTQKTLYDIQCIIQLFQLINQNVKDGVSPLIIQQFFICTDLMTKYLLAPYAIQIKPMEIQQVFQSLRKEVNIYKSLSWIIYIKQIIKKADEKGFGSCPPFQYVRDSYQISVKVTNNINQSFPVQSQIKINNYNNIYELLKAALDSEEFDLSKLKAKLNGSYITFNQLKQKICNITTYRSITLDIYETIQCEWFNKQTLFEQDGSFKNQIISILKEVYATYANQNGVLQAQQLANIFQKATKTEVIHEKDGRVVGIINSHSNNGISLKLQEWLTFYYESSQKNPIVVIGNLRNLGYSDILKGQQKFSEVFSSQNKLRTFLLKDGIIYDLLFKMYDKLMIKCSQGQQRDVINQFTSILKLLPPSQHVIGSIKKSQGEIFLYQSSNNLYYWYFSSIIQSIYFKKLFIQQYQQWKNTFQVSEDFNRVIMLYEKYLYEILSKGPNNFQLNSDIQIFILQNLGRIVRNKFSCIPSLIDIGGGQLNPLERVGQSHNHFEGRLVSCIRQLGQFCQIICNTRRNNQIAQNAGAIMIDIAMHANPDRIQVLKQYIFHQVLTVRQLFNKFYYLLSKIYPSIKKEYYSFRVEKNSLSSYKNCKQYFYILNRMLLQQEDDSYSKHISLVYQKDISQQKSIENLAQEVGTDQILLGKLKILSEIKRYNPETEISTTTISSIKELLENSISQDVRQILYSMSSNICDVQYSLQLIHKIMLKTKLKRNSLQRGNKKMGIMNLGCICYINSVLQQLQMIIPFRKGIIGAEGDYENIDFFKQFQYIIYQLTFGQRVFVIPQNFCLNYLDHNNMPINIKQQHDADQFLNQLLDRLQFRLKDTSQHDLINNNFKGQLVNVISCDKCYHKKEKVENFYILTVQIKNQSSLKECLNKLIEPQIICDYYCDFCEEKVQSIQKYNKFKTLPPFLFIHFQRLVFDLQTLMKIKLDHPVSFPTQIDLQQFYHYEVGNQIYLLKGFIVHQGSSQGGHYYSIIKCENGWIKFDDTRIDDWDWNSSNSDRDHAYLLIYQKKQKGKQIVSQQIKIGNPQIMKLVKEDIDHLMKEKIFLQPSFLRYLITTLDKISLPQQFSFGSIQINDPYHFNYNDLPQQYCNTLDLAFEVIIKFITIYSEMLEMKVNSTYDVMRDNNEGTVYKQNHQIQRIVFFAIYILHLRPKLAFSLAEKYLNDGDHFFKDIYNHKDKTIRQSLKMMLLKTFLILGSQGTENFLVPIPQNQTISKLLQKCIAALQEVGKSNSSKMVQFFSMLQLLCRLDNRFAQWFQANKLGPRLIHFYMQKESILHGLLPDYPFYMNSDRKIEAINYLIETLFVINAFEPDLSVQGQQHQLQRKAYLNIDLYLKFINERYENEHIAALFNYAAKNPKMNERIMSTIIQNLNRSSHQDQFIYFYIHILYGLLTIKDSLSQTRYQRLLGVPILSINGQDFKDKYIAKTDHDRVCKYLNPYLLAADEIMNPFLEVLYTNRYQHSYFTFLGIIGLLKLMVNVPQVLAYINQLPGPSKQYPLYVKWINDFIFNFQKNHKEEGFSRIPHEQKQQFLQQIVKNMRLLQIAQQKIFETQLKIPQQGKMNQYFSIGLIDHQSSWQSATLQFFENIHIFNSENLQQIQGLVPGDIIDIRYNILFVDNEGVEEGKVLQLRINTKLKIKLCYSEFYTYQLIITAGQHSLSLPYHQDMLPSIKIELLEQIKQRIVEKKQQKGETNMMDQYLKSDAGYIEAHKIQQFPSIQQVYEQPGSDATNQMNIEEKQALQIQCPFCTYISHQTANRCPNCNQSWGWE